MNIPALLKEPLRRMIRGVMFVLLRAKSRHYDPATDDRCVVIAPHQDDEAFGCAGLIHTYRLAALPVNIIYITDGSGSHPGHPDITPSALAKLRRTEAIAAMQHLGVTGDALSFLDIRDGTLPSLDPDVYQAGKKRLAELLARLRPTALFLPCRDDGSSEHSATYGLVTDAIKSMATRPRILEYPIWARWSPLHLLAPWQSSRHIWRLSFPSARSLKRSALSAYVSQIKPTPPWSLPVLPPGFVSCFNTAEEFYFERDCT